MGDTTELVPTPSLGNAAGYAEMRCAVDQLKKAYGDIVRLLEQFQGEGVITIPPQQSDCFFQGLYQLVVGDETEVTKVGRDTAGYGPNGALIVCRLMAEYWRRLPGRVEEFIKGQAAAGVVIAPAKESGFFSRLRATLQPPTPMLGRG